MLMKIVGILGMLKVRVLFVLKVLNMLIMIVLSIMIVVLRWVKSFERSMLSRVVFVVVIRYYWFCSVVGVWFSRMLWIRLLFILIMILMIVILS